jgi:hypothetical protein
MERQTERALYITLPEAAIDALSRIAHQERRHPRGQAAVLLLDSLHARGALPAESATNLTTAEARPAAAMARP